MHPLLKDARTLVLYLLAWFAPGLTLAALLASDGLAPWSGAIVFSFPAVIVYAFMSLSAWYLCRALPLRTTGITTVLLSLLAAALVSSALWLLLCYLWASLLEATQQGLAPPGRYPEAFPLLAAFGVGLFFIAAAVHYLIGMLDSARQAERNALELQILARDAELKALRAQINPHFLFNSLNSISALTSSDPAGARTMTLMLAEFLRLSMRYGALDTIRLDQEIALARQFLDIEKVRFGSRLSVLAEVPEALGSASVPPLLLQPIMENAVNHGIAQIPEGGTIHLRVESLGTHLRLCVRNPVEAAPKGAKGAGIGLNIVRQRLERLYGGKAALELEDREGMFAVVLTLPYHPA